MHEILTVEPLRQSLKERVKSRTGESVAMCYQCGKCSAGCPLVEEMDYAPNTILRMLQLDIPELDEKILRSLSIWLCLTCETCFARCPKEVDFPAIMDYLRSESIRRNKVNPLARDILAFHKTFLDSVRMTGRLYEVGLIAGYKLRTGHLFQDLTVAPKMFFNGLLKLLPHNVKGKDAIARMFSRTVELKEDNL